MTSTQPSSASFGAKGSEAEAKTFEGYVKYYLSDHRPLWVQIKI